ncbi:hypothetical protein Glove_84g39 [Diversispora epigaea]|uniref:Uncharacterized protein n=1 Tax=Diversispora epigaea TaxID=1348612 RepID=A0A397JHW9_9GLOM|nr:hypothetical protein Glove_84g39 [Diversispora epigaea]
MKKKLKATRGYLNFYPIGKGHCNKSDDTKASRKKATISDSTITESQNNLKSIIIQDEIAPTIISSSTQKNSRISSQISSSLTLMQTSLQSQYNSSIQRLNMMTNSVQNSGVISENIRGKLLKIGAAHRNYLMKSQQINPHQIDQQQQPQKPQSNNKNHLQFVKILSYSFL